MDKMDKKDKIDMKTILKARQFRKKLREKKAQEEKKNRPEEKPEEEKPSLLPSELNPAENPIEEEKKEDPLNFFNEENNKEEKDKKNEVLNEVLKMIEGDDKKEEEKKKEKKSSDSESNSSSESVEENLEEKRLLNMKKTQDKLFANKNNRVIPVNDLFKQKRNSEEIPKDKILEKFNINKEEELPELNEDKKKIMLKQLRKTIYKMNPQIKRKDSELRQQIEDQIDDLKKEKGEKYDTIQNKVQELMLSLKQPDFYLEEDEDVTQIKDTQKKMDIKVNTDIEDFEAFMKQTHNTN